jgi:hypothetical protein
LGETLEKLENLERKYDNLNRLFSTSSVRMITDSVKKVLLIRFVKSLVGVYHKLSLTQEQT